MAPSMTRDAYVIGKLGSYLAPSAAAIDRHLDDLTARIPAARPTLQQRIRADVDALLDRRQRLTEEAGPPLQ